MPSTFRQLQYLCLRVAAWLLWLPLTGNLRHDRTYGELKRLRPAQAAVMLVPLACYAGIAAWMYVFFPRELVPLAGSVVLTGGFLGGTLVASTVVATWVLERWMVYQ